MTTIPDAAIEAARSVSRCGGMTSPARKPCGRPARHEGTCDLRSEVEWWRAWLAAALPHLTSAPQVEPQRVIDEHMQQVAHRVMDVFENSDDDALADEVMSDVFAAIGLSGAFGSPSPKAEAPDLLREIFMDPAAKLREDLARVLVSHSTIPSIMPSHLSDCLCGRAGLTVTEHAKHVTDELASSGLVVPVGEVERLREDRDHAHSEIARLSQRWSDEYAECRAERDAALAAGWDAGVATALNHAVRNDDGITLRLDQANPYVTPTAIPARLLSGVHVGEEVVLPDGIVRGSLVSTQVQVVLSMTPLGLVHARNLDPDDVVTLVDGSDS